MIISVSKAHEGQRVDVFLAGIVPEIVSRSAAQKLLDEGSVTLGGKQIPKNYRVCPGDEFSVEIPEPAPNEANPENIPLDIIFEDKNIIIVNKPRGLVVHPAPGHYTGTLVNALLYHGELSGVGDPLRPGIVHRLDKDTSGLMVVAKNDAAHVNLAKQLADRKMGRVYFGIAFGWIKLDSVKIDLPISRHPVDRKKMSVVHKPGSKNALTFVKVLERIQGKQKFTFFEAKLETGRTHQIRVHMSHIGHPVYGDMVYGRGPESLGGQILHAAKLTLAHPSTGEIMEFNAPLPAYFQSALNRIRK